jgi:nucleotide-binding universal stress UspA family protein
MQTTSTYDRILVATNGSAGSQLAVSRGIELAAAWDADLVFVHVRPPMAWRTSRLMPPTAVPRRLGQPEQDETLRSALDQAQEAGLTAKIRLMSGETAREILATADRVGADLIVMGPTGHNPLREHAGPKVRRSAKCPMLVPKSTRPLVAKPVEIPLAA